MTAYFYIITLINSPGIPMYIFCNLKFLSSFQETDFVCFDTGYDKFDNYDIDLLLGSSLEENDKGTPDQTQPSADEETHLEKQTEHPDNSEDLDKVPDDQSASLSELEVEPESPSTEKEESNITVTPDVTGSPAEDTDTEERDAVQSVLENVVSEMSETKDTPTESEVESVPRDDFVSKNEPVSISEGVQIPELKTTLGTTFDAVTTNDEITTKVTPYEEEESKDVESPPEDDIDDVNTPLLTFSEENVNTPASDSLHSPPTTHDDKPETAKEKNMWTSLGDAVFSVVTGGKKTPHDLSSEEDEDDEDEEEETVSNTPQSFEEAKKHVEEPLTVKSPKETENIEPVLKVPPNPSSVQTDHKETDDDSEKDLFDQDDGESDDDVIGPGEAWEETLKPTDEPTGHQTEASKISVNPVSQDYTSVIPEAQNSDIKTTDEPPEHKAEVSEDDAEVNNDDDEGVQDSGVAMEHSEDLDNELAESETVTDQELSSTEPEIHQDPDDTQSDNSDVKDDEKTVDNSLSNQIHDHLITDLESNNSQPELSEEEPEIHEEILTEEWEDEKETEIEQEKEEEKEQLLEDENAISFSLSDDADSDKPSPETTLPSTPEPEYSDNVMRLSLLRDHFTEEKMERIQKLLGLKNLWKLEAMFSDLDTELQATRLSHTGSTQDIENALEGILEASENTILDEIEKMLDSGNTKQKYDQDVDTSGVDEETEILDEFQELAFSLRQKYSTASDSTPLAEKASDIDQGGFVFIIILIWLSGIDERCRFDSSVIDRVQSYH